MRKIAQRWTDGFVPLLLCLGLLSASIAPPARAFSEQEHEANTNFFEQLHRGQQRCECRGAVADATKRRIQCPRLASRSSARSKVRVSFRLTHAELARRNGLGGPLVL